MTDNYSWYRGSGPHTDLGLARRRNRRVPLPELATEFAPKAPPPPFLIAGEWGKTCKGATGRYRCGVCALCEWEAEAERWAAYAPWIPQIRLRRSEEAPRWPNIHAALRALAELEWQGRSPPSPLGEILENLKRGAVRVRRAGTSYRRDREDPLMKRASELADVARALENAYPDDNPWGLEPGECQALLMVCTDGVLKQQPTLIELEREVRLPAGLIRSIVKFGRKQLTIELAARGLIPMPARQLGLHDPIDILQRRRGWVS